MLDHKEGIGPLDVQSAKENAFSDQDLSILQIVAGQIALSISNNTSKPGASFVVPNEPGKTIEIIVDVKDNGSLNITDGRRLSSPFSDVALLKLRWSYFRKPIKRATPSPIFEEGVALISQPGFPLSPGL